jgi:maleylacetate reductase
MWAPKADPINAAFAAEGIRAPARGLPKVVTPFDLDGREHVLYAAYLSAAFASAGSALHHKICHLLSRSWLAGSPDS